MVIVKHVRLRSQTIVTSSGSFMLDAEGKFEATAAVADYLCDETKYGDTFKRVDVEKEPEPEPEVVEEETEPEAVEEVEEPAPVRKKKMRRKKKIARKSRA